jgi:hypothetical protein
VVVVVVTRLFDHRNTVVKLAQQVLKFVVTDI